MTVQIGQEWHHTIIPYNHTVEFEARDSLRILPESSQTMTDSQILPPFDCYIWVVLLVTVHIGQVWHHTVIPYNHTVEL